MEEYTYLLMSAASILSITTLAIAPLISIGCGGKKAAAPEGALGADGKPAVPTKACNTKSGLLNDDPDLKSDLLMAKPAAGAAPAGEGAAPPAAPAAAEAPPAAGGDAAAAAPA